MAQTKMDPLLLIAKAIIWLLIGVLAFTGFIVVLGIPASVIFSGEIIAEIEPTEAPAYTTWLITGLLVLAAGALYLGFCFFRNMLAIVNSVGEGDPFVPANGDRLTAMAWLVLAINILAAPIGGLVYYLTQLTEGVSGSVSLDTDFGGIVLILTLFILARVFRHGTAMREDLEGTV